MEDLIPFLLFLVIGAVKLFGFLAKNSKQSYQEKGSSESKRDSSQLKHFFEQLSEQLNPQEPTELPDWPEGYERPNYLHEMETYKEVQPEIMKTPEVVQEPEPNLLEPLTPTTPHRCSLPISNKLNAFQFHEKKGLRQAMLAHILFSPPRALDDTLQK